MRPLTSFDKAQPWFGGIYTYLPAKKLFTVEGPRHSVNHDRFRKRGRRPSTLLVVSFLPLLVATLAAFLIIWFTPTVGLTCRHVPSLSMLGLCTSSLYPKLFPLSLQRSPRSGSGRSVPPRDCHSIPFSSLAA